MTCFFSCTFSLFRLKYCFISLLAALIAILMADLTDGLVGLALSTLSIVVVGEIIPQAACSRHGLFIGANTVWIVKIFIFLMYVVARPISMILDRVLGRDIGQVYSAAELNKLIRIHVENPDAQEESGLNREDGNLLTGALEYKDKKVADVMTTLDKVFMVETHTRLTFPVLIDIYKSGFTRIPVYEIDRQNIVGILFTKDLILIDPDDEVEIAAVISFHGNREGGFVRGVPDDTSLDKVFREFKSNYLHLLVAYGAVESSGKNVRESDNNLASTDGYIQEILEHRPIDDYTMTKPLANDRRVITGIISLEDVLEAVIKDEIVDETDNFVDVNKIETVVRGRGTNQRPDPTNFLTLFEHKIRDYTKLSESETAAITAFLSLNVAEFKKMARFGGVLKNLIMASQVKECEGSESNYSCKTVISSEQDKDTLRNEFASSGAAATVSRSSRSVSTTSAGGISATLEGYSSSLEDFCKTDEISEGSPLYKKGSSCDYFTLILQGKVLVYAGSDEFVSELGPWCYIGQKALVCEPFIPDFRATPQGSCRLLYIRRGDYKSAMRAAQVEAMRGSRTVTSSKQGASSPSVQSG